MAGWRGTFLWRTGLLLDAGPVRMFNSKPGWRALSGRWAGVAQLVEQLIRNQQVSGSSPLVGSKINELKRPVMSGPFPIDDMQR